VAVGLISRQQDPARPAAVRDRSVAIALASGVAIGAFLVCLARAGGSSGLWPLCPSPGWCWGSACGRPGLRRGGDRPDRGPVAVSGTLTLTRVDANGYAGTFDVTFSDGSHATGSFSANRCAALTPNIGGVCT